MTSIEQQRANMYQQSYKQQRRATIGWLSVSVEFLAITGTLFAYHKGAAIIPAIATYACFKECRQSFKRMKFDAYRLKHVHSEIKES